MKRKLKIVNADVFADGQLKKASIVVNDGIIEEILEGDRFEPFDGEILDCTGKIVLPGSIDTHVHIREPGSEERETFLTGTMAAANGGVTTVLEHPISVPPPYNSEILENRINIAKPQMVVDCGFYGALGTESIGNVKDMKEHGIVSFKTFLQEPMKGREREFKGLTISDDYNLLKAMEEVHKYDMMMAFHAENDDIIKGITKELTDSGRVDTKAHYESRPIVAEIECIIKLLVLAKAADTRILICHITTSEAMKILKTAKEQGIKVIVETCPQYIFTSEEECIDLGPMAKCNPPIRKKDDVDKIWDYINDGTVDIIGSDHGPYIIEEKMPGYDNIFKAPAGFPGLETRVPLMLDAVNKGKMTLAKMVELICENPAKIFKLDHKKGFIKPGLDADFMIVDMTKSYTIDKNKMYTKGRDVAELFNERKVQGYIEKVILRGNTVMEDGVVKDSMAGYGQLIKPYQ
jgi:dihydropyrimidinase/allantoinase